jgi:hypothetical protein
LDPVHTYNYGVDPRRETDVQIALTGVGMGAHRRVRHDRAIGFGVWMISGPVCFPVVGFAPERRESDGKQHVGLRHRPFLELAETRAGVVCPIHLGLMQGALKTWQAPVAVERLDAFVEPDLCLAHLTLEGVSR